MVHRFKHILLVGVKRTKRFGTKTPEKLSGYKEVDQIFVDSVDN